MSSLNNIDVTTLTAEDRKNLYVLASKAATIELEILKGSYVTSTNAAKELAVAKYRCCEREVFGIFFLNQAHQLISIEEVFFGTNDRAAVYPREVIKLSMKHNASAVVLFHNHPSWQNEPSPDDIKITKKLRDILKVVNVRVLDHLVIGGVSCSSFAELGLLP